MEDNQKEISELSIEESFEKLEELLGRMEDEDTGLEDAFRFYEEGLQLVRHAKDSIDGVEKKIQILKGDEA